MISEDNLEAAPIFQDCGSILHDGVLIGFDSLLVGNDCLLIAENLLLIGNGGALGTWGLPAPDVK